jgi:glycyl-tRNA synthetase beta chain
MLVDESAAMPSAPPARLPQTPIGMALAILDRFDTLVGYFSLGIEPTADADPFGLRRAAQGIVEVAWAAHRPLPLDRLFNARAVLPPLQGAEPSRVAATGKRIQRYLLERLYTFDWPKPIPSADTIDAVLSSPCSDLIDAMDRIMSLQHLNGDPGLFKAAKVIERTRNILRGVTLQELGVDPTRFQEPLEHTLWELYRAAEPAIIQLSEARSYGEATTRFGETFFTPLHEFFARVLVNVPDQRLQQNRLALLRAIQTLYTDRIADLSQLTLLQREEPAP